MTAARLLSAPSPTGGKPAAAAFVRPRPLLARLCIAAMGVVLATAAGDTAADAQEKERPTAAELLHPNGLRLALPQGYRATRTPQGFVVEPAHGQLTRSGIVIQAAWLPGPPPETHRSRRELTLGRVLRYSVRQTAEAVGSGGAEYTLSACEPVTAGSVCLWQTKQGEHGAPSFELWAIALGVTFEAPATPAR